jgi:hypothetical protein
MGASTALIIGWCVHLFISVCCDLGVGIALLISRKAPPANGLLVKLIGTKVLLSLEQLPALNFQLDVKLILHLVFFMTIAMTLWIIDRNRHSSDT